MRGLFNNFAQVKRLSAYVDGKAELEIQVGEIEGHFEPIDNDYNNVTLQMQGQAFLFVCEAFENIQEGDILIIENTEYGVRGVAPYKQKGLEYLRILLEKTILQ